MNKYTKWIWKQRIANVWNPIASTIIHWFEKSLVEESSYSTFPVKPDGSFYSYKEIVAFHTAIHNAFRERENS